MNVPKDPRAHDRAIQSGQLIVAAGAAIYLVSAGSGALSREMPWRLVTLIAMLLIAVAWFVGLPFRPSWRPDARLGPAVLLVAAAYFVSAVTSTQAWLGVEPVSFGLGLAVIYFILVRILQNEGRRILVQSAAIGTAGLVAGGYLVVIAAQWIEWLGLVGRITLPPIRPGSIGFLVGGPNAMAGFPMLFGPMAIVALVGHGRLGRVSAVLLTVAILAAALLSGSRGGALGFALGMATFAGLSPMRPRRYGAGIRLAVAVLAVAIGSAVVALILLSRGGGDGLDLRLHLWEQSLRVALAHPLFGSGPGSWELARYAVLRPGDDTSLVTHAHNVGVQTLAELGIIGLGSWLILVASAVAMIVRTRRSTPERALEVTAIGIGLATIVGQSLVENFADIPTITIGAVVLLAYVDALATRERTPPPVRPRLQRRLVSSVWAVIAVAAISLVSVGGLAVIRTERAARSSERGDIPLKGGVPSLSQARQMARSARAAATLDPGVAIYQVQLGAALSALGRTTEARATLEQAISLDPFWAWSVDLAWVDAQSGDPTAAIATIRTVAAIYSDNLPVLSNAAAITAGYGDPTAARSYLAQLFAVSPRLAAQDGWWWASSLRDYIPQVINEAKALLKGQPLKLAELDLWTGATAQGLGVLAAAPASAARAALFAATPWFDGQQDAARQSLDALVEREPLNIDAVGWALRLARSRGDKVSADRYARWIQIVDPIGGAPYLNDDGVGPGDRPQQLSAVGLHASSAYRLELRTTTLVVPAVVGSTAPAVSRP